VSFDTGSYHGATLLRSMFVRFINVVFVWNFSNFVSRRSLCELILANNLVKGPHTVTKFIK
jgi:hypothetical protein